MAMLSFERKYRVPGGTLVGGDCSISGSAPFTSAFSASPPLFFSLLGTFADRLWSGNRSDLERLADQHRPARPEATGWASRP